VQSRIWENVGRTSNLAMPLGGSWQ
jgi:hypothetical protein